MRMDILLPGLRHSSIYPKTWRCFGKPT